MANLINSAQCYRAWVDWDTIATAVQDKTSLLNVGERLLKRYPQLQIDYADARRLIAAAPNGSPGQRVLTEMLVDVGEEQKALAPGFLPSLERRLSTLRLGLPALSSAAAGQDKLKV